MRVAKPIFSILPGTYNNDLSITLSTPTEGATIHYTTDGSMPTISSPVYTAPISITGHGATITIQAFAKKNGISESEVTTGV